MSTQTDSLNLPATIQPGFGRVALSDHGAELRDMSDLKQFALMCLKAKWAGKDAQTAEHVMMKVIQGKALGLPPMTALQNIAVINDRPCLWGDAMKAVVEASGECEYCTETIEGEGEKMVAVCEVKRKGRSKAHTARFSWKDAMTAGLVVKGTWKNYPRRMLQLRARAFALRDQFADKLCGVMMAEEMQDVEPQTRIVSGDVVPPQDLDEAAALIDQDQPAVQPDKIDEPDFGNEEEAEFQLVADREMAKAVAAGDATPIGRGPGEMPF